MRNNCIWDNASIAFSILEIVTSINGWEFTLSQKFKISGRSLTNSSYMHHAKSQSVSDVVSALAKKFDTTRNVFPSSAQAKV